MKQQKTHGTETTIQLQFQAMLGDLKSIKNIEARKIERLKGTWKNV